MLPPADGKTRQQGTCSERINKVRLAFPSQAKVMYPLQSRFVFWTPAILYLRGGLSDRVFVDFLVSYDQEVVFYHHRFHHPFFAGLTTASGDNAWNSVLWATEREHWDALVDYMCSIAVYDKHQQLLVKYATQEVEIADPIHTHKQLFSTSSPLITVQVLCVRTNFWTAALELDGSHPLMSSPKLSFYPADEQCKMYADAVFGSDDLVDIIQKEQDRGNQDGLLAGDDS